MNILLCILLVIFLLYSIYFIFIGFGLFKKNDSVNKNKKVINKFAILIAARNEEKVIGNLIDCLKKQDYPKDKYDIYVIINNCTDKTLDVAKKHGAKILECKIKVKSKGEVLEYAYSTLKTKDDIDAYAIFDADNIVDNNFLNVMNDELNKGYNVAQGLRKCKNMYDNYLTTSYALLFYIQCFFLDKPRYNLNMSSFINGTGFIVRKKIIDKFKFSPKTLTEDVEFTIMCALNKEKIAYVEDAIFYDEQVITMKDSIKQRKRWSFGSVQCLRRYGISLFNSFIKNKNINCLDILLFIQVVTFQIVMFLLPILVIVANIFNYHLVIFSNSILYNLIFLLFSYVMGVLVRLFLVIYYKDNVYKSLPGILLFDIFLLSWIPIHIVSLFRKDLYWEPIEHNINTEI